MKYHTSTNQWYKKPNMDKWTTQKHSKQRTKHILIHYTMTFDSMHRNMVIFVDQNIWFPSGTIIASCCANFSQYLATIASICFCNRATLCDTIWLTNQWHQIFTFFYRLYVICACSSSSYDSSSTCTRPWISKFTSFIQ